MFEDEDCRRFEEMVAIAYEQAKRRSKSLPSQMPNEVKSKPPVESTPSIKPMSSLKVMETNQLEEIEEQAVEGELLAECGDPSVRANVFRTRCLVQDRACSLIIYGGVYTNFASTTMIEKLNMPMFKHPCPYKLEWLNDNGMIRVNEQVLFSFSIGKYNDEVLCDVVPMQAGYMILGRQWQLDRQVSYNGISNKYSFKMNEKTIALVPLPPKQAHEDQMKLQKESDQKRESEQKTECSEQKKKSGEKKKESIERKRIENEILGECKEKDCEKKETQVVVIEGQLERKIKERDEKRGAEVKEREKEILVVSSENESEGRQKNCCAKMSGEVFLNTNKFNPDLHISILSSLQEIKAQHHGRAELEHGQQALEQVVDELELESCCPKKLMGFKTERGLFEWVTNSVNLNNAFVSLNNQNFEPFLEKIVLKGFDHWNITLSCSNSSLNCYLSISWNDQLLMVSFEGLTANLRKCTFGMDEIVSTCSVLRVVGKQVVAEELNNMAAVENERNMEIICGEEQGFPKTAIEARKIIEKGIKALQCLDRINLVDGIQSLRHEFYEFSIFDSKGCHLKEWLFQKHEFAKIDFKRCFSKKLLGFKTKYGLFVGLVASFGLTNTSMRLLNYVLRPTIGFVIIYFKGALFYYKRLNEHALHLRAVLGVLHVRRLFDNLTRCTICMEKFVFVCFVVSTVGIQVLESIGMKNNIRERSQEVRIQRHEPQEEAIDENKFFTEPRDNVRAELKIDFIGVDRFDVHLNFLLIEFFNKLRKIGL
ncbi:hypothetical protein LguiB_027089 [Lonicera macranthoides]